MTERQRRIVQAAISWMVAHDAWAEEPDDNDLGDELSWAEEALKQAIEGDFDE